MTDPYRSASTEACPECSSPLLAPDDDGVRACPKQCGEWASRPVVDRMWGTVVAEASDPGLQWSGRKPFACVMCAATTKRHMHDRCTYYRCAEHGVWFHRESRARLEVRFVAAIGVHRGDLAAVQELSALLHRVGAGDLIAIGTLARRWVALERRVKRLPTQPR